MSLAATQRAWATPGFTPTERLVLLDIADRASKDGRAWPSIEEIMERTGLGKTAVYTAVRVLKAAKLLNPEWLPGRKDVPAFVIADTESPAEYSPYGRRQAASEPEIPLSGKSCSPGGMLIRNESPIESPMNPPGDQEAPFSTWQPKPGQPPLTQALAELFKRAPELKPRRAFAGSKYGPMLGSGLPQALESKLAHAWSELEQAVPPASWADFLLMADWFLAGEMQWATDPLSWIIHHLPEAVERAGTWKTDKGKPVSKGTKKGAKAHADNSMVHPADAAAMKGQR